MQWGCEKVHLERVLLVLEFLGSPVEIKKKPQRNFPAVS